jgi:hypothetical protein
MKINTLTPLILAASLALPTTVSLGAAPQKTVIEEIREELLELPYYGVFDFLAFGYDQGTVTLQGYAYALGLKRDAERAVKRVAGVDTVKNEIEDLPVSPFDDDLRWRAYYEIYRDPFLSRYAPGGALLWGHRHPLRSPRLMPFGPPRFAGLEPAGDYPIHIVVKGGHITLLGVVENEGDKTIAGIKARSIPGAFSMENELVVEPPSKKTTTR